MSSSSQATDLSMDEILASIRKIIAEEPKPATATVPKSSTASVAPPVAAGRSASQIMTSRQAVDGIVEAGGAPARPTRAVKPALDDDILDLMDEVRTPAAPPSKPPAAPVQKAEITQPAPAAGPAAVVQSAAPAKPSLNDMWTPREWSRGGGEAVALKPPAPPTVSAEPAKPTSEAPEARLEAAIAALGQSLAAPTPSPAPATLPEAPAKPIVVASAPPEQPGGGPRIDVVAVVNAATRAALAQRSADQQVANPAFALPPESRAEVTARKPEEKATTAPVATAKVQAVAMPSAPSEAQETPSPQLVQSHPVPAEQQAATPVPAPKVARSASVDSKPQPIPPSSPVAAAAPAPEPVIAPAAQPAPAVASAPAAAAAPAQEAVVQVAAAPISAPATAGVQTLEDTVARLLRPMLRQWLDDNMPRIVEKAFKEELAAQAPRPRPGKPN